MDRRVDDSPDNSPDDSSGCGLPAELYTAIADDLRQLAALHDRELDVPLLAALRLSGFPDGLGLSLDTQLAHEAAEVTRLALAGLGDEPSTSELDELGADYASIYLNHGLQASPFESTWLDEDGLQMQTPMFQVRDWYRRYGLGSSDWRLRADDHLSLQLLFVAHLFDQVAAGGPVRPGAAVLGDIADFLDQHLLRWLPDFGKRIAIHSITPFYAGIGMLTAAYIEELRQLLETVLQQTRPTPEAVEASMRPAVEIPVAAPARYEPGVAPTW